MSENDLVKQFINITGSDEKAAIHMLEACSNDLEMAVSMYLDNRTASTSQKSKPSTSNLSVPASDDNVRAPIPQTKGVLVEEGYATSNTYKWNRMRPNTVFDGFRDFRAETKRQEELSSSNKSNGGKKLKRLEDLFRPPLELVHRGTLETARKAGENGKKWLIVSVHNVMEFACQVLNRDVWSKKMVQDIIKENFVFWQVYSDSEEGAQFLMFYPVTEWPHVAILDPRTGEQLLKWKDITPQTFIENTANFLAEHGTLSDDSVEPPSKRLKTDETDIIDESEDLQLKAAIEASLKDSNTKENEESLVCDVDSDSEFYPSSDEAIETEKDNNEISIKSNEIEYNHNCPENGTLTNGKTKNIDTSQKIADRSANSSMKKIHPKSNKVTSENACNILIRFPDGNRDKIVLNKDNPIKDLLRQINVMGYSNDQYELITNFPKQNLSLMDLNDTLSNAGLYPRATVFVQEI